MMVAIHNVCVEYCHCTVRQIYENMLNDIVKVINSLWVSLAIPYVVIKIMQDIGSCEAGTLRITFGWIIGWMYHNCCYNSMEPTV